MFGLFDLFVFWNIPMSVSVSKMIVFGVLKVVVGF